MRFEPLPPLFEGTGWDRVAAAELEAERQRERKECSRENDSGSWTSRDVVAGKRERTIERPAKSAYFSARSFPPSGQRSGDREEKR